MRRLAVLSVLACAMGGTWATADSTVNVTPSNMNEWTLNSFDGNGTIVNSGPYYGTAAMTTGPATPPIGTGSAHLATPAGAADGAAAIATESYDTTLLSSITSLSYSTYDVTNNGQQFPYLAISIDTGAIDNSGNGNTNQLDTLFFEPPYQQGTATGNGSLPKPLRSKANGKLGTRSLADIGITVLAVQYPLTRLAILARALSH
jgi:hypothetical protein